MPGEPADGLGLRVGPEGNPAGRREPARAYAIDHVVPLKRGGADALGNMQWQTTAAAKVKDRVQ